MISEDAQDQAALYALGLLDADEAAAFERALAADAELRTLADGLREAAATLARTDTGGAVAPVALKARVLATVAGEKQGNPAPGKVIPGPGHRPAWHPWVAAAAALVVGCAPLGAGMYNLRQRVKAAHQHEASQRLRAERAEHELAASLARPTPDGLRQVSYCPLGPVPAAQQTGPQAAVLWDAAARRGRLQIQQLPPPGSGKDYQLWTVEAGHKNPVSAGVVKLDADGGAAVDFQPGAGDDAQAAVTAFALSVERAGGVPQNEGPILFLGKLAP